LADDHATARRIAEGIHGLPGVELDMSRVQSNILRLGFSRTELGGPQVSAQLRQRGVLASPGGPASMRLVTHHHVTAADADAVVAAFRDIFTSAELLGSPAAVAGTPY